MSIAQDTALAYILGEYARQLDALKPSPEVPKAPKAPKLSTSHRKPRAAKADVKPFVPTFAYTSHSVGPEGFFSLLRKARGMQEEREAINAFQGYNDFAPHGPQLDESRRRATLALNSHLGHRSAKHTADGWVKGAVDITAKQIGDLEARERLCAEEISTLHNRLANVITRLTADTLGNNEESDLRAERDLTQGLLLVSNERLQAIRADLARLEV